MMNAETGVKQAGEFTKIYFLEAIEIWDEYFEGEVNFYDHKDIFIELMRMQERDFVHSCKLKQVILP